MNSGQLWIQNSQIIHQPSFLEYIMAGAKLKFSVAIDFTKNNGETAKSPTSLHYVDKHSKNFYQKIIINLGELIEQFASPDRVQQAQGFGAYVPGSRYAS